MKVLLYLFPLIFVVAACSGGGTIKTISQGPIWIDVRSASEYASGHLPEASNISHKEIGAKIAQLTSDKDMQIHLYCGSGKRAGIAKQTLTQLGYTNVVNEGGYKEVLERRKE